MMEDRNALIADCIVVSCCCQCLILQLVVLVFLHLPRKIARKTREYARRKLFRRRRKGKSNATERKQPETRGGGELVGLENGRKAIRAIELEGIDHVNELHDNMLGNLNCMDEVEKVLEEMSLRGEFGFGSFWDGDFDRAKSCSKKWVVTKDGLEYGSHVVKFHLIEVVGSVDPCDFLS